MLCLQLRLLDVTCSFGFKKERVDNCVYFSSEVCVLGSFRSSIPESLGKPGSGTAAVKRKSGGAGELEEFQALLTKVVRARHVVEASVASFST